MQPQQSQTNAELLKKIAELEKENATLKLNLEWCEFENSELVRDIEHSKRVAHFVRFGPSNFQQPPV